MNFEESTTIELSTQEGDEVQVMAPGDPYFDVFEDHASGPVPLFEVEDVHRARAELEEAGIEIVGEAAGQPLGVDPLPSARRSPL